MLPWVKGKKLRLGLLACCLLLVSASLASCDYLSLPETDIVEPTAQEPTQEPSTEPTSAVPPEDTPTPSPEPPPTEPPPTESLCPLLDTRYLPFSEAEDLVMTEDGHLLAVITAKGVEVINLESFETVASIATESWGWVIASAMSSDVLALAADDDTVRVFDLADGQELYSREGRATTLAFSPDGTLLAVGLDDGGLDLLEADTGEVVQRLDLPGWSKSVSFAPNGELLGIELAGDIDENVELWDIESGEKIRGMEWTDRASPALYFVLFSPDWTEVAWVARGTVLLMDVETGEGYAELLHEDFVSEAAFSQDGDLIVTTAGAQIENEFLGVIFLWDVATGEELDIMVPVAPPTAIAFSPDGEYLVVGESDGRLSVWDMATRSRTCLLDIHEDVVSGLGFTQGGLSLVAVSYDGRVSVSSMAAEH